MSLLRTLAAVAVGVAANNGARANANRGTTGGSATGTGGGLLDSLREQATGGGAGGLGGLGALLGGGGSGAGSRSGQQSGSRGRSGGGGLGGLLEEFGGSGALGGLGGMLAGGGTGGALGGLLGALTGGNGAAGGQAPAFGQRLNEALRTGAEPETPPTPDEEAMAALMIRAMIMAAKADGRIDQAEREALLGQMTDLDPAERRFVQDELAAPVDIEGFARDVPDHPALKAQIFAAAMSAIDIDSAAERQFAEDLASALDLDENARGHVQRRMSGHYGAAPEKAWDTTDKGRAYAQPIQPPAGVDRPGKGRPYRK